MSAAAPSPSQAIVVRDYTSADEQATIELLQRAFGRWPRGVEQLPAPEFFRWKHHGSPFGASTMLIAELDAAPVGFIALMPWRLSFGGRVLETVRGVDLAVDPGFRMRGVAMELIGPLRSRYGEHVVLGWSNPNEQSRRGTEKSGRERIEGVRRFVGLGGARIPFARRVRPAALPASKRAQPAQSARVVLEDGELLERVLGGRRETHAIATAADAPFLRWRYGHLDGYRALAVGDHAGRAALAIFRVRHGRRGSIAHVCELLVQDARGALARRALHAVRRATRTDLLDVGALTRSQAFRSGLVRSPRSNAVTVNPLAAGLEPDPTLSSSWALSLGDFDLI